LLPVVLHEVFEGEIGEVECESLHVRRW
jgi:hypothetical protein